LEWDENNLRKIRAHGIHREEAEQAINNNPISVYEQDINGEIRAMYHAETRTGRLLAVVMTMRGNRLRVVTAYEMSAAQKRSYHEERLRGE